MKPVEVWAFWVVWVVVLIAIPSKQITASTYFVVCFGDVTGVTQEVNQDPGAVLHDEAAGGHKPLLRINTEFIAYA
jgi:hypothetical protein